MLLRDMLMRKKAMGAAGAVVALALAGSAQAVEVDERVGLPANLKFDAVADQCMNNPGPYITLAGELTLGGLNGRLIFQNNEKGTHTHEEEVSVDLVVIEEGETIRFAKQPPQGGVGGNPHIFIQFYDGSWRPISDAIHLGRCVQGIQGGALLFEHLAEALFDVVALQCQNSPGPEISVGGTVALDGLNAKLIFTNNLKGTHTREEAVEVALEILPKGGEIVFPKQPVLGGVGGNPRIYFQFTDSYGQALSRKVYLGRCVQMSK